MKMDAADLVSHELATHCFDCNRQFGNICTVQNGREIVSNIGKHRHHDHLTGNLKKTELTSTN